jgi:serine protease inhibitor
MKYFLKICIMIVAGIVVSGCKKDSFERMSRDLTPQESGVVRADNGFGFRLFKEISRLEGDKNVFISPLSVAMALTMTYNGAGGTTREEMESVLELSGFSVQQVDEAYGGLMELLTHQDPNVDFRIANSIWYRQGFPVEEGFITTNATYFDALVSSLDFDSPEAGSTINRWVDENTNGKIQKIVDGPIDPAFVMFLINAVYFKGAWRYEFKESDTTDDPFTLADGSQKTCKMMMQECDLRYFSNSDFQAVDMPYGDAGFSMTVILPHQGGDVDSIVEQLDEESWSSWLGGFFETGVEIHFPRLKLEYGVSLNEALRSMGMEAAFDPERADFTGIGRDGGLYIDQVKHKSFVEVNEEGTEAAAVTSVETIWTSEPYNFPMRVDRPFIFMIRESHTGAILFMGKIVEPPQ